jgi:transcriptional regulator with XRE-family HTH domain
MTPWYIKAEQLLRQKGMTIKSLSDKLGLTPSAVGHYLSGRRDPKPRMLQRIAEELSVSIAELVEDDPTFARDDLERYALKLLRDVPKDRRDAALAMLRGLTGEQEGQPPD